MPNIDADPYSIMSVAKEYDRPPMCDPGFYDPCSLSIQSHNEFQEKEYGLFFGLTERGFSFGRDPLPAWL